MEISHKIIFISECDTFVSKCIPKSSTVVYFLASKEPIYYQYVRLFNFYSW